MSEKHIAELFDKSLKLEENDIDEEREKEE